MRASPGLVLSISLAGFTPVSVAQKTPDTLVHTGPQFTSATLGDVVADGSFVGVAWLDLELAAQYGVQFRRSLDAGATWEAESVLSGPLNGDRIDDVSMTMSGDSVYVVWAEESDPVFFVYDVWFNRSLDRGATWLATPIRINTEQAPGVATVFWPQVAATGSSVHVVWHDSFGPGNNVLWNGSTDSGTTWPNQPVVLNTNPLPSTPEADFANLAVNGDDVHVVWRDGRDGDDNIHYNRSSDGGATWLASDVRLSPTQFSSTPGFPAIAVEGAVVVVAWDQGGELYTNRSTDGGATWLPAQVDLNSPGFNATGVRLVTEGNRAFLGWYDKLSGGGPWHAYIAASTNLGATWSTATQVDGESGDAVNTVIAYEAGVLHVAWSEDRNGPQSDIFYNRSLDDGATWLGSDLRLDTDNGGVGNSVGPRMAAGDEQAYVVWMDNRNQSGIFHDLYFNLPFGAQSIGSGSTGSGGFVPLLDATGPFAIGASVSVQVSQGLGGAKGQLYYGFSGVASIPLCAGTVYIQPPFFHLPITLSGPAGVPGAGSLSLFESLDPDPSLVGLNLTLQALLFDPGGACGIALSNGLDLWIG